MYRHRKDSIGVLYPSSIDIKPINKYSDTDLVYLPLVDTIPSGSTNVTVDAVNYIVPSSSLEFTDGYITLDSINLGTYWTLEGWFYLTQDETPIFSIGTKFYITYSKLENRLKFTRLIFSTDVYEVRYIPISIDLNAWNFIAIYRNFDNIYVQLNLDTVEFIEDYFYDIGDAVATIGSSDTLTYTGNLSLFRLNSNAIYPNITSKTTNLDTLKAIQYDLSKFNEASEYKLLQLDRYEVVNNSLLIPSIFTNTYYDWLENHWYIPPQSSSTHWKLRTAGLRIVPDIDVYLDQEYTLELIFKLSPALVNDVVICSNWSKDKFRYYYFIYTVSDNHFKFIYYKPSTLTTVSVDLGAYIEYEYNYICLQRTEEEFSLFLNGILVQTITETLIQPYSPTYDFNVNIENNISSNAIYLKSFLVTNCIKYLDNYIPYQFSLLKLDQPNRSIPVKYHTVEQYYPRNVGETPKFTLTGSTSLNVNSSNTYTITQTDLSKYNQTYQIRIKIEDADDLTIDDITVVSSVILNAGSLSTTFTVTSGNYPVNPYKKRFTLIVFNNYDKQELIVNLNEIRSYSKTTITNIAGYAQGFLAKDSTVAGTIPNLSGSVNATTVATMDNSSMYGKAYRLQTTADEIVLPSRLENIQTVMLIYRELDAVANRSYVGDDIYYTFNGGAVDQLIGSLILNADDYAIAMELDHRSSIVKLSRNDDIFVVIDDFVDKVYVYEKTLEGIWNTTPTEIITDILDTNYCQDASIAINTDGTIFALGFKNGNNGEGIVQVWKKIDGIWTKDLHLGSPTPAPYLGGFGNQVAISDDGLRLVASQLGSNSVYVFEKTTLWDADPVESFIGVDRFGYKIDLNADGTLLAIVAADATTTYLYRLTTTWSLEDTIVFGLDCKLHPTEDILVLSSFIDKEVRIYDNTASWSLQKTITSVVDDFSYSISIAPSKDVDIASPGESKVYRYKFVDDWDTNQQFSNSNADFGYNISSNTNTVVISNYEDLVQVVTNNSSTTPQKIIKARQSFTDVSLSTSIKTDDIQILTFQSEVGLNISRIGNSKINTGLNGIFLGALFFTTVITNSQVAIIEDFLCRYLGLDIYSII